MSKRKQRFLNVGKHKLNTDCQPIPSLTEWKKENPGKIYFDSDFECYTWHQLEMFNIKNLVKPIKIQLVPAYDTWTFDLPKNIKSEKSQQLKMLKQKAEDQKHLTKDQKKKLITKWKSELTREFNYLYKKELVSEKSKKATWEPDFLLPEYKTFLECKGGQGNDAWRNTLKLGRWKAYKAGYNVVVVTTQKEVNSFIYYLLEHGMKNPKENVVEEQNLKHELIELKA